MRSLLLFSGTTEGRQLAGILSRAGVSCTVCVATAYGQEVMPDLPGVTVREGRMDAGQMYGLLQSGDFACAADATHPFAREVSENIRAAAKMAGVPCLRVQRETEEAVPARSVLLDSMEEAAQFLARRTGRVFVTTGSKEIGILAKHVNPERITARVLPDERSIGLCRAAGLAGAQIIAMQGPFTVEMNALMLRESAAAYLLTKETGGAGGFREKMRAAAACAVTPVIIRNPEKGRGGGHSVAEAAGIILRLCGAPDPLPDGKERPGKDDGTDAPAGSPGKPDGGSEENARKIFLIGAGPGDAAQRTAAAEEAIASAQVIFGAKRILERVSAGAVMIPAYDAEEILSCLAAHPEYETAAVVFSGDTGFYSGAARALRTFGRKGSGFAAEAVCGISSLSYFASKTGKPWQEWKIASAHGRICAVVPLVRKHPAVFLLAEGAESVRRIGRELAAAQRNGVLGKLAVTSGFQLACPEEEIRTADPAGLSECTKEGLYVLLIEQDDPSGCSLLPGLPDDAFERGAVPMTKEEVRALVIAKLGLTGKAVLYDIGAGTGSVSIEAALLAPEGRIFAIEEKEEACGLIEKNREKFGAENLTVVPGQAPEAFAVLPSPTHVFIGGSGGRLKEILSGVLEKNPAVRIVLTTVTTETLSEVQTALRELPAADPEILQVQVSRAVRRGRHHLLTAQNPVFVIRTAGKAAT